MNTIMALALWINPPNAELNLARISPSNVQVCLATFSRIEQ